MILKQGHTYDFKYGNYHVDPAPHLYVLQSDRKYTIGFNTHYWPLLRYSFVNIDVKNYKRLSPKAWDALYAGMMKQGYYKRLAGYFRNVADKNMTPHEVRQFRRWLDQWYPWLMGSYRMYHTKYIYTTKLAGKGFV